MVDKSTISRLNELTHRLVSTSGKPGDKLSASEFHEVHNLVKLMSKDYEAIREKPVKRIPIKIGRMISKIFKQDQVILLTWDKKQNLTHLVTYGKTKKDCKQAAEGGKEIKEFLELN